ncbi:uncharacterized protein LOC124444902 isoform X3 [Xenia sp. Carnegie-2017]|uniref:uncharacterized protein LOC124444902 isoform X3 n=1 Tax=Xenia sp. Carnegie-2017 TaxID=2897299 RepID=UPI001F04D8D0|nr:uncharacterized protein LOC124444902 isoform X3 [Xenia sp. Carnegie-2017]
MAQLNLEAENLGLRETLQELHTTLSDEKNCELNLRREHIVEVKQIREEERKRCQEKEKEIAAAVKRKDEESKKRESDWNRDQENLLQKLRFQITNETKDEVEKMFRKQVTKLEVCIEDLKEEKRKVEERCKIAEDADKKKMIELRRAHAQHEQEILRQRRLSWKDARKQMTEIRQLTNIIHHLEKKLGIESCNYIRSQLEKDSLKDKLDQISRDDISGRKSSNVVVDSSESSIKTVGYPSFQQIQQQKIAVEKLEKTIKGKDRRIEILKQKLYKSPKFASFHSSMDDIHLYEGYDEREDCISPVFSACSSSSSSIIEETIEESQDVELLSRLHKEILQLQKVNSFLQQENDDRRKEIVAGKGKVENDLFEAQRQIDELNKELVESHDRNELLEFQLQELIQENFLCQENRVKLNVPTICVDYQFSDEELMCSTEDVKASLEKLQNEKKPMLSRNEQLALARTQRLLLKMSNQELSFMEYVKDDLNANEDFPYVDRLNSPIKDDNVCFELVSDDANKIDVDAQSIVNTADYSRQNEVHIANNEREPSIFAATEKFNSAIQCNILCLREDFIETSTEFDGARFKKVPCCSDIAVQTEVDLARDVKISDDVSRNLVDDDVIEKHDGARFKKVPCCSDIAVQTEIDLARDVKTSDDVSRNLVDDDVIEKHDGEASEKSLIGGNWKDLVIESGENGELLDCLVYVKEGVLTIIGENYRKCCSEITSMDVFNNSKKEDFSHKRTTENKMNDGQDSPRNQCLCKDIATQCEFAEVLSFDGLISGFSGDLREDDDDCEDSARDQCLCKDIAIQCEFAEVLSFDGLVSGLSGDLREDDDESLIKEVMALAKECSQNDLLINQHFYEVVKQQEILTPLQETLGRDFSRDTKDMQTQCELHEVLQREDKCIECAIVDDVLIKKDSTTNERDVGNVEASSSLVVLRQANVNNEMEGGDNLSFDGSNMSESRNVAFVNQSSKEGTLAASGETLEAEGDEARKIQQSSSTVKTESETLQHADIGGNGIECVHGDIVADSQGIGTQSACSEQVGEMLKNEAESSCNDCVVVNGNNFSEVQGSDAEFAFTDGIAEAQFTDTDTATTVTPSTFTDTATTVTPSTFTDTATTVTPSTFTDTATTVTPSTFTDTTTTVTPSTFTDTATTVTPSTFTDTATTVTPSTFTDTATTVTPSTFTDTATTVTPSTFTDTATTVTPSTFKDTATTMTPSSFTDTDTATTVTSSTFTDTATTVTPSSFTDTDTATTVTSSTFTDTATTVTPSTFTDTATTVTPSTFTDTATTVTPSTFTDTDTATTVTPSTFTDTATTMIPSTFTDTDTATTMTPSTIPASPTITNNFGEVFKTILTDEVDAIFESDDSSHSNTSPESQHEVVKRESIPDSKYRQPPPVLPKPKYFTRSVTIGAPPLRKTPSSLAAQKDIVDGCFPPEGLVSKRASEFNHGEIDILKEKIVYLERQIKNKDSLLETVKAETTEIETNAYIKKKEDDIKMMDETIRFLKVENKKRENEAIAKIDELIRCNGELEQLHFNLENVINQRDFLMQKVSSTEDCMKQLKSLEERHGELKCDYDSLTMENTQLKEQLSRLERADKEFVVLERTISNLQNKLNELEEVRQDRDKVREELKELQTENNEITEKLKKLEAEKRDFSMNNLLSQQEKGNLQAKNCQLLKTNDNLRNKVSDLDKEVRDLQGRTFNVEKNRDEANSQLRKCEMEKIELRQRLHELLQWKANTKLDESKSRDFHPDLRFLHEQFKKIEREREDLSYELGDCLKERNELASKSALLVKLSNENKMLEEKLYSFKLKIAELTGQKEDAEVQLPTLKAKLALLKQSCREKDEQMDKFKRQIRVLKFSIASFEKVDLSNRSHNMSRHFPDTNNNVASRDCNVKQCVVLFDYDPQRLSSTGHPESELKVKKGDVVTVLGDLDVNGYYMGELNGKRGLVSSLYVEDMNDWKIRKAKEKMNNMETSYDNFRLKPTSDRMYKNGFNKRSFVPLQDHNPFTLSTSNNADPDLSLTKGELVTVVGDVNTDRSFTIEKKELLPKDEVMRSFDKTFHSLGLPSAPSNLHVIRCVNEDCLLVGWIAPYLDEFGRNGGHKIEGYNIIVNGVNKLDVESPFMAKALIENLDLTRPLEIAIRTVAENGFFSEKSVTHFNESAASDGTTVIIDNVSQLNAPYRTFVALFSYAPMKSSPNPDPSLELGFQEGDIVRILDTTRPDGYFVGEINGKRGLVPSNFIEEIATVRRQDENRSIDIDNTIAKRLDLLNGTNSKLSNESFTGPRGVQFANEKDFRRVSSG